VAIFTLQRLASSLHEETTPRRGRHQSAPAGCGPQRQTSYRKAQQPFARWQRPGNVWWQRATKPGSKRGIPCQRNKQALREGERNQTKGVEVGRQTQGKWGQGTLRRLVSHTFTVKSAEDVTNMPVSHGYQLMDVTLFLCRVRCLQLWSTNQTKVEEISRSARAAARDPTHLSMTACGLNLTILLSSFD